MTTLQWLFVALAAIGFIVTALAVLDWLMCRSLGTDGEWWPWTRPARLARANARREQELTELFLEYGFSVRDAQTRARQRMASEASVKQWQDEHQTDGGKR